MATQKKFKNDAKTQHALAAINEVKQKGNGIPAEVVLAKLQSKLVAAKHAKNKSTQ